MHRIVLQDILLAGSAWRKSIFALLQLTAPLCKLWTSQEGPNATPSMVMIYLLPLWCSAIAKPLQQGQPGSWLGLCFVLFEKINPSAQFSCPPRAGNGARPNSFFRMIFKGRKNDAVLCPALGRLQCFCAATTIAAMPPSDK